jgi:hypothetical protein
VITIQVVPGAEIDAYRLLRTKVSREASTWFWHNKARTRLRHTQRKHGGYIEVAGANGVLVARVVPASPTDLFYLVEKFVGRLVAWFEEELVTINIQFVKE